MTTYDTILYEVTDGVATLTLNRPERLNAWNTDMAADLGHAMAAADGDDAVKVIIITGAGRAFCAGQDLSSGGEVFASTPESNPHRDGTPNPMPWDLRKPVVAAMNGHAIGVGLTFPLAADLRFVAQDAKLQFAFVRRGIVPELASTVLLPAIVGSQRAADLLLSGRIFTGAEAAEIGLALEALPADEVLPAARAWAAETATASAPVSVATTKALMWQELLPRVRARFNQELELVPGLGATPDANEGVMHFLEKRTPSWQMSVNEDMPPLP